MSCPRTKPNAVFVHDTEVFATWLYTFYGLVTEDSTENPADADARCLQDDLMPQALDEEAYGAYKDREDVDKDYADEDAEDDIDSDDIGDDE